MGWMSAKPWAEFGRQRRCLGWPTATARSAQSDRCLPPLPSAPGRLAEPEKTRSRASSANIVSSRVAHETLCELQQTTSKGYRMQPDCRECISGSSGVASPGTRRSQAAGPPCEPQRNQAENHGRLRSVRVATIPPKQRAAIRAHHENACTSYNLVPQCTLTATATTP